ncbi:MAG: hypothetical protein V4584_09175 [Verrucomicrobiota bacterium]
MNPGNSDFFPGFSLSRLPGDLEKAHPDCPPPQADAGEGNTEIVVKIKLSGVDANGEFNFLKGILVSHGFEVLTANYQ